MDGLPTLNFQRKHDLKIEHDLRNKEDHKKKDPLKKEEQAGAELGQAQV